MNPVESEKLRVLLGDKVLLQALRKVFDEALESESPMIGDENNQVIGEKYRAYDSSKKIIESAFTSLDKYIVVDKEKSKGNRAI